MSHKPKVNEGVFLAAVLSQLYKDSGEKSLGGAKILLVEDHL